MQGKRRKWPIVVSVLVAVLLVASVAGYWYARPLLRTGTGYAAHNLCAVTELAGRDNAKSDLPPNPLVPYLTPWHDAATGESRVTVVGMFAGQNAWYTDGFGCTVGAKPQLPEPAKVTAAADFPTAELDPAVEKAIDRAFGADLNAEERAALGTRAVVILRDGVILGERYADGFTADTRQLGWSMTKSVTNLLTGRLVLEGKVALDDAALRPEWTDERAKITVDDLLRMTSGLEWEEAYDLGTPITQMLYAEPDMAGFVASKPLAHAPGSFQQYSSGSTTLLCSVLTAKAGKGPNLPREELFAPLGLSSAVLEVDGSGNPVCGSYLWATPRDWARIGKFALDDGVVDGKRLLPEGWMKRSTTVEAVAETDAVGMGASWWANRLPDGTLTDPLLPADAFWANGHDGQRVIVLPSERLVVVRMGFTPVVEDERASQLAADIASLS